MFGELVRLLIDVIEYLWPFRRVDPWERGVYIVMGKHWRGFRWLRGWPVADDGTVGPGVWPVVPWFSDVNADSVTPGILPTALQTITLKDGQVLTFSATCGYFVENYAKALIEVEDFRVTALEALAGIGEILADTDPARFDPSRGKRDRLREEIAKKLDDYTRQFGVRITWLNFPNFVMKTRVFRLLQEKATLNANA